MLGKRLIVLVQVFCFLNVVKIHVLSNEQTDRHSEYTFVYPQKVHQKWKRQADAITEDKEERVTYSLIIGGKNHFLHLEKNKDFLAKDFVQFSYDASGKLVTSYPDVYNHCHYHGRLEGHEDSLVALSTCSGLSGVILFGNKSYGIEPVTKSTTNQHYIFPLKSKNGMDFCGVTSETDPSDGHAIHEPAMSFTGLLRKKRNLPGTRYVKMVLVVDKNRYDFKQDNMTATRMEMVSLANLMDRYYQQLNIHVALVGLVVLQTGNPFSVNGTAGQVLQDFVTWRKTNLLPQIPHDVAHLVVGRGAYPGGILGMAFEGTVCSESSGGGISVYPDNGLAYYSTIIAHELGHNLGLNHDNTRCTCNGGTCIMDAYASGSTLFSICSANDFATLILQGRGICLAIQPSPTSIITVPVCGNGIVDNGEQCDCGKPENCTNRCCDPATCQFTKGSTCAQGSCCDNCQMAVAGTPCRPSVNSCDLPEFCTGQSGSCPSDYYIMDGLSCLNNTAYCYEGRCQSYDYQCQRLFGTNAKKAPDLCFNIINGQGTQFGNCGYQGNSPIGCSVPDSLCGKVQCSNVNANFPPEGAIITVQNINGTNCVNADFNLGPDVQDPGYVKPGSSCAQDKTCLSFQCVNSSQLLPDLQCNAQTTCNGNGVCNNLGNCHCNDGWGPPWCNKAGFGGSINSGPAEIDYSLRNGLLIFFLLVVPLLIIIAVVLICVFKRDWVKLCLRKRLPNRSTNATGNEGNSHVPRGTTPQPRTQERPQQTISSYPAHIPGPQSRYEDLNYGAQREVVTKTPHSLPTQGPGVPKPIPLRPNQLQ